MIKNTNNKKKKLAIFTFFMMLIGKTPVLAAETYTCDGIFTPELLQLVKEIYNTVVLLLVVALIIFGIMDFIQGLSGEKDDALKKASSKFIKRVIIVMIIALLPILIDWILSIFWPDLATCLDGI